MKPAADRTLIVIETPFQLLCANEYVRTHDTPFELIIRLSGRGSNDDQLRRMSGDLGLPVFRWEYLEPRDYLGFMRMALSYLRLFRRYERVVIGSFFSGYQRAIAHLASRGEIVLLDDGMATLLAHEKLARANKPRFSAFSIFDLEPSAYRSFQRNSLQHARASAGKAQTLPRSRYFIGQVMVDRGAMSLDGYLRLVRLAASDGDDALVYVPHRMESDAFIEAITRECGVQILRPDCSIEYYFVREHLEPSHIYAVNSTALYSIATMFPSCQAVAFDPDDLRKSMFEHYDRIISVLGDLPNVVVRPV